MGLGRHCRGQFALDKRPMSMKFPVAPQSIRVVVLTICVPEGNMIGREKFVHLAMLLVHGIGHGKKTLRRLPKSKILIVRECGGCGHFFSVLLIANFQGLEDIFRGFSFSGEVLDVSIDGSDGSDGSSGGDSGFGVSDLLEAIVPLRFSGCLRGAAFICAVFLFATSETQSFPDALSSISQEKFL